jgi:Uncharacterized conserved protein (DUF2190)
MRIILNLLLLISFASFGQVFQTQTAPYEFTRGLKSDSLNIIPRGCDTVTLASTKWGEKTIGALYFDTCANTLYAKGSFGWVPITGGVDSTQFEPVIDSTGNVSFRVLYALGNKIVGSANMTYDTANSQLIVTRISAVKGVVDTLYIGTPPDVVSNYDPATDSDNFVLLWDATTGKVKQADWAGTGGGGDTTGLGDLYIRNQFAVTEGKKFNILQGKLDALDFDLTPTIADTTGRLNWDSIYGTLAVHLAGNNVHLQVGQEQVVLVRNNTGSALSDGQVVYITGSTGEIPTVALANNKAWLTASRTLGVVTEPIAHGAQGYVTLTGIINGLNTNAFTEGAAIWLDSLDGQFTETMPQAPYNEVLLGYIVKKAGGNGSIFVRSQNSFDTSFIRNQFNAKENKTAWLRKIQADTARYETNVAANYTVRSFTDKNYVDSIGNIGWRTNGNSGTNPSTNFIGTTDNKDFVIRRNNLEIARFSHVSISAPLTFSNISLGVGAGNTTFGSNFFGYNAGNGATGANYSNFLGTNAGKDASAASNSTFIGSSAGNGATNSLFSNFIGEHAGQDATDAQYSNIIGYYAGASFSGNNLGPNNIIIGSNISLPDGATNAINIGGLIFGLEANSTLSGNPVITPSNGNVGIGIANPEETAILDLSSTTRGALIPRLTTTQQTAISSPATGLLLWNTDSAALCEYTAGAWRKVDRSGGSGTVTSVATGLGLTGGTITTTGTVSLDTASATVATRQRSDNTYSPKLDTLTSTLLADVSMPSSGVWYSGPSVTLPVGTWMVMAHLSHTGGAANANVTIRLDGTTAAAQGFAAASRMVTLPTNALVNVASGTTTITLQAMCSTTSTSIAYQTSYQSQAGATRIIAVKIK